MSNLNYWKRATRGAITRRRFVAASAGVGSAAWLAACGGDKKETKAPTAPAGQATTAAQPTAAPAQATGQPQKGGVYRTTSAQVYDSVDVHRAFGDPTSRVANQTQNKFVRYKDPNTGEIEADLAEKWEVPDAATYTFSLNKGVKFHNVAPANGREFVADDVKWHIERQASNKLTTGEPTDFRFNAFWKTVTRIETPDKYTVKVTLAAPNGTFLDRLAAFFSTIPNREATEQFEADHRNLNEAAIIGTGPFIPVEFRAGKDVKLKRNPDYFRKDQPYLDGMVWTILFEDPNAARAAFTQKQLDIWNAADPSVTKQIIDSNRGAMYEVLTGVANTVALYLNVNKFFKNDNRLVQAMNLAIDRRQLIQTMHQGLGQVSGPVTWIQEGFAIPRDDLIKFPGYRTDRELEKREARQLWQAAGGPSLGEIDITVPRTWAAPFPDTQQIIPKMLNDNLGVMQFKSTLSDYNENIIPNLFSTQYPSWYGWITAVTSPDPRSDLRNSFHSKGSSNFQKVNNPQLDKLLDEMIEIVDQKRAVAKVREVQEILMQNAQYGVIILYNYITRYGVWNYWHPPLKEDATAGKPGSGYFIDAGHLIAGRGWIDTKDPSYQGRPPATI